jgi:ATP-dependent Clp protease ATP-binding subunit ClpA
VNWFKSRWEGMSGRQKGEGRSSLDYQGNFSPRAQQVLALARKEADRFHHNFVGTEHLLLGLIKLGQGVAVNVLLKMGLDLETVRMEVEKQVGPGPDQKIIGNIPYTPRVKKVLQLAAKEAQALTHTYVGTEHILLGLLREGDGVAARVLKNLDVDIEQTRQEILKELDPTFGPNPPSTTEDTKPSAAPLMNAFPKALLDSVDTSKRYDVYCSDRNQQAVVYRNAIFKGRSKLLSTRPNDWYGEFLELEQANGQTVFLALYSVIRFCEHGVEIIGEIIPPK